MAMNRPVAAWRLGTMVIAAVAMLGIGGCGGGAGDGAGQAADPAMTDRTDAPEPTEAAEAPDAAEPTDAADPQPIRIVCFGDSLTSCGGEGGRYSDWLERWLGDQARVFNRGVGGDTLAGGRQRFEQDVLALEPDVVIIGLGANDYWQARRPLGDLEADLSYMVGRCRSAGAEVVIASCFGHAPEPTEPIEGIAGRRARYAWAIGVYERQLAARFDAGYVPDMQADIRADRAGYWSDANHPNRAGNRRVAERLLPEVTAAMERLRRQR